MHAQDEHKDGAEVKDEPDGEDFEVAQMGRKMAV